MTIKDDFTRLEVFCEGPFEGLCTPAEFAEINGLEESTIRHAIRQGRLEVGKDCFKFGKQWVLSPNAFPKFSNLGYDKYFELKRAYNNHPERG